MTREGVASGKPAETMDIDILIEDPRWDAMSLETISAAALGAVCAHAGLDPDAVEVSILACDDARMAELNSDFRDKPKPTNVLSWPSEDLAPAEAGGLPHPPRPDPVGVFSLGDVAIAFETCEREAQSLNKPVTDHVTHLIVHGILHLLGYDHIRDPDATLMQTIETDILGKLGVNDPYRI